MGFEYFKTTPAANWELSRIGNFSLQWDKTHYFRLDDKIELT